MTDTIRLGGAAIRWTDFGVETIVDGRPIGAWPHPEQTDYHVIAARCGYGYDLLRYCREHELAHLIVEDHFHARQSRVLSALASGKPLSGRQAAYEEMMAQALQRFVRAAERPIIGGVGWDRLRARFLSAVAHLDANWERARMAA